MSTTPTTVKSHEKKMEEIAKSTFVDCLIRMLFNGYDTIINET